MLYTFGDIVIVEKNLIGVVVKSWMMVNGKRETIHEVYVRDWNSIKDYPESKMQRYLVRHKELSDEELEYQANALRS